MLQEILGEIKSIKSEFNSFKSEIFQEITSIKSDIDIIKGQVKENYDILGDLEHRVEENTAQLTAISQDLIYVKGDISKFKNRLDYQFIEIAKNKEELIELKKTVNV